MVITYKTDFYHSFQKPTFAKMKKFFNRITLSYVNLYTKLDDLLLIFNAR